MSSRVPRPILAVLAWLGIMAVGVWIPFMVILPSAVGIPVIIWANALSVIAAGRLALWTTSTEGRAGRPGTR